MTALGRPPADPAPSVGSFAGVGNRITTGDDGFVAMLGYERERFDADREAGVPLSPPEWAPIDRAALARATRQRGVSEPYEKVFLRADGTELPVLVTFTLDPDDPARWVGYAVALPTDRPTPPVAGVDEQRLGTYQHLLAEMLRERHRITTMLDATRDLIWSVDTGLRLRGANAAFVETVRRSIGWDPTLGDDMLGTGLGDDEVTEWRALYGRALGGEDFTHRYGGTDGVFDLRFSPIGNAHQGIVGVTIVATDVTAADAAERGLAQSQRLLAIAARLGRVAAWTLDPASGTVTLSAELIAMFDLPERTSYPLEEAIRFYPESERDAMSAALVACADEGIPVDRQVPLDRTVGLRQWVRVLAEPALDDDGRVVAVHGAIADITDEVLRTERLREQASLLDNASDAMLVRRLDGVVTYWNRAAEDQFGWTAAEAIGRHIADLVDGGDLEKYDRIHSELLERGEWSGRIENRDRDGNPLMLDLHLTPVTDHSGQPVAVFSISRDVGEQVALERRLAQSQKLELIGQLAGGVAHDFNNLLTVISGSAELLAEMVAGDAEASSLVEMLLSSANRGGELTQRLLAAARRQPLRPKAIDPVVAVEQSLQLLRRSLPEAIEIVTSGPDEPWTIEVDPAQFEAAILNLALNARDAMDGRGRISIVIDHIASGAGSGTDAGAESVAPGEYVRLSFSDDGRGMDDTVRSRAFDPFFTTKPAGTGSGLGLAMVHGFARQSGGSAELVSTPGAGTTIVLLFPRAGVRPVDDLGRGAEHLAPRGREHLLVVEDDDLVREQTVATLTSLGYRVDAVADADHALQRLDAGDPAIELVFSDVVMPGRLDGVELAAEIGRRWPGLPVILTSGYHEAQHAPVPADITFLPKPYRRRVVARAIRRALDRAVGSSS